MKRIVFLLVPVLFSIAAYAQDAVSLNCVNIVNSGQVSLEWTSSSNCGASFEGYEIFSSDYSGGPYILAGTVTNEATLSYVDYTSFNTSNTIYYYVVTNCTGSSAQISQIISTDRPEPPEINYVSVLPTGEAEISFLAGTSPDTYAYIVYNQSGGFNPIDTIFNPGAGIYTHTTSNANVVSETYTLAAMDSCEFTGPFNDDPQHSLFLSAFTDSCNNEIFLDWNAYINWSLGVDKYELWVGDDFASLQMVEEFSSIDTLTTYTHTGSSPDLCIQVRAVRFQDAVTAHSNLVCVSLQLPNIPEYIAIQNLSVIAPGQMEVSYYLDPNAGITTIRRMKSNIVSGISPFDNIVATYPLQQFTTFTDMDVSTGASSWFYQIGIVDSCGNEYFSPYAESVFARARSGSGFRNQVVWTGLNIEHATVQSYEVFREDAAGWSSLDIVDASTFEIEDYIGDSQGKADGSFCYRVEATYDYDHPSIPGSMSTLISRSNEVCTFQPAILHIPNAFAPNGVNKIFKPVPINVDPDSYTMVIFNRWGEVMYTSSDIDEGWNGIYKNKVAPEGVYAYYFSYANRDGISREKKGSLLLVR